MKLGRSRLGTRHKNFAMIGLPGLVVILDPCHSGLRIHWGTFAESYKTAHWNDVPQADEAPTG